MPRCPDHMAGRFPMFLHYESCDDCEEAYIYRIREGGETTRQVYPRESADGGDKWLQTLSSYPTAWLPLSASESRRVATTARPDPKENTLSKVWG